MKLYVGNGKVLDTGSLPPDVEGVYCSQCGCRLGWLDSGISGPPMIYCDECACELGKEDED